MKKDHKFIQKIKDITKQNGSDDEEYYIVDMVKMNYAQVFKIMVHKFNADINVKSKKEMIVGNQTLGKGTELFKIAQKIMNSEIM
jgi:hypothetical protein